MPETAKVAKDTKRQCQFCTNPVPQFCYLERTVYPHDKLPIDVSEAKAMCPACRRRRQRKNRNKTEGS